MTSKQRMNLVDLETAAKKLAEASLLSYYMPDSMFHAKSVEKATDKMREVLAEYDSLRHWETEESD